MASEADIPHPGPLPEGEGDYVGRLPEGARDHVIIEVIGEGIADIGSGEKSDLPDSGVVPILVHKLCGKPARMRVKRRPFAFLVGKKLPQKVQFAKRQASLNKSQGAVFVVDSEGAPKELKAKRGDLEEGRGRELPDFPMAIGVAHPCIESWLLAAPDAIRRGLELAATPRVPEEPEKLPARRARTSGTIRRRRWPRQPCVAEFQPPKWTRSPPPSMISSNCADAARWVSPPSPTRLTGRFARCSRDEESLAARRLRGSVCRRRQAQNSSSSRSASMGWATRVSHAAMTAGSAPAAFSRWRTGPNSVFTSGNAKCKTAKSAPIGAGFPRPVPEGDQLAGDEFLRHDYQDAADAMRRRQDRDRPHVGQMTSPYLKDAIAAGRPTRMKNRANACDKCSRNGESSIMTAHRPNRTGEARAARSEYIERELLRRRAVPHDGIRQVWRTLHLP